MKRNILGDLIECKRARFEIGKVEENGSFQGYASLFETADLSGDVIEPGAFARSLAKRGASGVRMLYQHDPHQPIGVWLSLEEDKRGLRVWGQLTTGVDRACEVFKLMKSGALDGLSVGFRTIRARNKTAQGMRRILEADLWEISVVTFPMLPDARIHAVKSENFISRNERMLVARICAARDMFRERKNSNAAR